MGQRGPEVFRMPLDPVELLQLGSKGQQNGSTGDGGVPREIDGFHGGGGVPRGPD